MLMSSGLCNFLLVVVDNLLITCPRELFRLRSKILKIDELSWVLSRLRELFRLRKGRQGKTK